jgi:hypothetical protein
MAAGVRAGTAYKKKEKWRVARRARALVLRKRSGYAQYHPKNFLKKSNKMN